MSMSDPIADMLTRIRNAHMADKTIVMMPYSKIKEDILHVMHQEGYIISYDISNEGVKKSISVNLKYYNNKPVIDKLIRISKPSLRVYTASNKIPKVMNGLGIVIISTPKGIMTGVEAKKQKIGGELLCSVE